MRKVILKIIALVVALTMMVPFASVVMAQPEITSNVAPVLKRALTIKAPETAPVGQPVPIQVVERTNAAQPVYKARVWAIDLNNVTADTEDAEVYAELVEKCGHFLGWTNERGYVFPVPRFERPGRYILVATKDGYIPGFSKITITPLKALAIKAPETAPVGQPVPIQVVERTNAAQPVYKARVWAIDLNNVTADTEDAEVYAELVEKCGHFLGWTNERGYVFPVPRFERPGRYILVATKDGYIPGFSKITITPLKALAIKAPETAPAGQPVPIQVVERTNIARPVPNTRVREITLKGVYSQLAEKCRPFFRWVNERSTKSLKITPTQLQK